MRKKSVLVSIPHASLFVPQKIRSNFLLTEFDLKNISDTYTDKIFEVPNAHILIGEISRLVCNLNRSPDGIEEEHEHRVTTMVSPDGQKIFQRPLTPVEVSWLIKKYHHPFHRAIKSIMKERRIKFFIDGHSMWSTRPKSMYGNTEPRADVCLGNREFTTCTGEQTEFIRDFFLNCGYSVKINNPYSGKYNVGYHCHRDGVPGIQIEFNRKIFMDEENLDAISEKIYKLNKEMERLVDKLAEKFC